MAHLNDVWFEFLMETQSSLNIIIYLTKLLARFDRPVCLTIAVTLEEGVGRESVP